MYTKYKYLGLSILFLHINVFLVQSQSWEIDTGYEQEKQFLGNYSDLYDYIEILVDTTGDLSFKDIGQKKSHFKKNNSRNGFEHEEVYWLKATVKGSSKENGKYLFSIGLNSSRWPVVGFGMTTWPYIDIYIEQGDSIKHIKSGFKRNPAEKEIQNAFSFFWLDLNANEEKTIYARLDPDGGYWNSSSMPESISAYFFDPASLDLLDGTYTLRNLGNDPVRAYGNPRLWDLFEVVQLYPDTTCSMNLDDVIKDWDSHSVFFLESLEKETCYWTYLKVINPDSVDQMRIFYFPKGWQQVTCFFPEANGQYKMKTIGSQMDQNVFYFNIRAQDTLAFYFRYPTSSHSIFPLLTVQDIYEKDYLEIQPRAKYKFLLLGALLLPFLFFLIQYAIQKDKLTFYYLIFLLGSSLYLISILDQIQFFELSPKILKSAVFITSFYSIGSLLSLVGLVNFIHLFLEIRSVSRPLLRVGNIILWFFSVTVLLMLMTFNLLKTSEPFNSILLHAYRFEGIIVFVYALFLSIYGFIKKIKFGGALLIAFSPLLISGVIYAVVFLLMGMQIYFNWIDVNLLLAEGFILAIILFGVVIGVRNNSVKEDKIKMQEDMLVLQQKVNRQLIKVDSLKDQFLANTSHELRTPLLGIIGLSESLFEKEENHVKKQELSMIASSGKRLSSLVNSILDFSKLKSQDLKLTIKTVDIRTITDVVIHISKPLIKGKSVNLINEINPSTSMVNADEDRMYQIMHNLIGNAIKFTNEGSIEIAATEKEDMVVVSVKDSGIGIPEDKIDDIFKSFEQVDASITREQGGTGLGLTITKQLIELQGGSIWVESKVDEGTIVYLTLPKSTGEQSIIREEDILSKVSENVVLEQDEVILHSEELPVSPESRFTILIVDDEPVNQQVLSNHLSGENFRILQAMNGKEALKMLDQEKLDLVLLDIMMPKMSGYEVCREIRKQYLPSELPVIMITAKDQVSDLVEGLGSGANDYLAKPFSRDELIARLKTHLNLYNINTAYLRFIPKEFIEALGHESIVDVELGDQVQGEMTIMFSDIRSFTSITEQLSAKESFEFLNSYLNCITPAITSNGGFIDKYIGDAVMALFPFKPEDALVAAIEAQKNLVEYNKIREGDGKQAIKIGIGLHTGPLMIGTIGVKNRMDGTVISDAVNLASRLEELNKHYGTSLIVSEETMNKIEDPEKYHYRFLSIVSVKGKHLSNKIFEFFDGDSDHDKQMKIKTMQIFRNGIDEYYGKRFTQASVLFQEILNVYPEDKTAKIFLKHAAKLMVQGVPDDWDGVDIVEKVF